MIEEGCVALVDGNLNLYTKDKAVRLARHVWKFAMVGRRIMLGYLWTSVRTVLKEDVMDTGPGRGIGCELVGEALGHFVLATEKEIRLGSEVIHVGSKLKCSIINGAITYQDSFVSGYTFDDTEWADTPGEIVYVNRDLAYVWEEGRLAVFDRGVKVYDVRFPMKPTTFLSWHGQLVTFSFGKAYLFDRDGYKKLPAPDQVAHGVSNNFMLVVSTFRDERFMTTDLRSYQKLPGHVTVADGMMISLRQNGYRILHVPSRIDRILSRRRRAKRILASFRRFTVPFVLYLLVYEFLVSQ